MTFWAVLFVFGSWLVPTTVHALPTGANSCNGGGPAVGGAHLTDNAVTGALADGSIVLAVNNFIVDPTLASFEILTAIPFTLLVSASSFRGALIRVSSSVTFTLEPGVNGQVASVCTDSGVSGVTHTSNEEKTELAATLVIELLEQAGERVPLDIDVTVVVSANPSVYYHSRYTMFAGNDYGGTTTSTRAPNFDATTAPTHVDTHADEPVVEPTPDTTTAPPQADQASTPLSLAPFPSLAPLRSPVPFLSPAAPQVPSPAPSLPSPAPSLPSPAPSLPASRRFTSRAAATAAPWWHVAILILIVIW